MNEAKEKARQGQPLDYYEITIEMIKTHEQYDRKCERSNERSIMITGRKISEND